MQVKLLPCSHKGKNRLLEAKKAMPEWDLVWKVLEKRDSIPAKEGGPVLFLVPLHQSSKDQQHFSRWINETGDKDFIVQVL